jgi:hypothetical protein
VWLHGFVSAGADVLSFAHYLDRTTLRTLMRGSFISRGDKTSSDEARYDHGAYVKGMQEGVWGVYERHTSLIVIQFLTLSPNLSNNILAYATKSSIILSSKNPPRFSSERG